LREIAKERPPRLRAHRHRDANSREFDLQPVRLHDLNPPAKKRPAFRRALSDAALCPENIGYLLAARAGAPLISKRTTTIFRIPNFGARDKCKAASQFFVFSRRLGQRLPLISLTRTSGRAGLFRWTQFTSSRRI